jgi:hypothetical protein
MSGYAVVVSFTRKPGARDAFLPLLTKTVKPYSVPENAWR